MRNILKTGDNMITQDKHSTAVGEYIKARTEQLGLKLEDLRNDVPFLNPSGIKDADLASDIIVDTIINGTGMIVLNTDYDLDGISSGAIGYSALVYGCGVDSKRLFILQNQRNLGNGFNKVGLDRMIKGFDLKTDIMITSDHGSSDEERYKILKEKVGCKIVVTDHHLFKSKPVSVDAFVNTQQEGDTYCKNISGGVTIWLVMMLVKDKLSKLGDSNKYKVNEKRFESIYPLASLTTVCDQMDMTDNTNRYIVTEGLKILNSSNDMRWQEVRRFFRNKEITSTDLAFRFGPMVNATGRMNKAESGSMFLIENEDSRRCRQMFELMIGINNDRKDAQTEATELVRLSYENNTKYDSIVTVAVKEKIGGLAGPIASGYVDKEHKPTLILYPAEDGILKGSGRSVDGIHLENVLKEVKEKIPTILNYAAGHAGAVGVSINESGFEEFCYVFNDTVKNRVRIVSKRDIDYIKTNEITLELYNEIQSLGPFGRRWKEPTLILDDVKVVSANTDRRRTHAFYKLTTKNGNNIEGFKFKGYDPKITTRINVDIEGSLSHKGKGNMSLFLKRIEESMPF
jgi:single-stranded-DNA-specific exonuclease